MLGSRRLIIQRAVTRLTRSGGSRPELRLCRSSSGNSLCGQNSVGFRESARPFKGIICDDISEFESYPPSHAVRSPPLDFVLKLSNKERVSARSVVIASGARYRQLAVDGLASFEAASVHYWASPLEAKLCAGQEVALVGAGDSAGRR